MENQKKKMYLYNLIYKEVNKNDFALNLDNNYFPEMQESTIFVIYFRRDTGKYYIKNIDANKEKYFIFILIESPYVIININNISFYKETIYYFLY